MAGQTILVVDDNATNVKLVRDVLEFKGYVPVVAEDGHGAVAAARAHRPALILMDVQLPGMSGTEAMKVLKADEATKHIPIVALTALAMKGAQEDLLAEGFDAYVSKPFNLKELIELVQARVR